MALSIMLGYLDRLVEIFGDLLYELAALAYLRCELTDPEERRQMLSEFPGLLELVEAMPEDWELRDKFLGERFIYRGYVVNAVAAVLWRFRPYGAKPLFQDAHEWWLNFLKTLPTL